MKLSIFFVVIAVFVSFGQLDAIAQTGSVTGSVTDSETGEVLPGVNIVVEGTTIGAATDSDGIYQLDNVGEGSQVLRATFIGYTPQDREVEVIAGETVTVDFELVPRAVAVEGLVVVGYGEQERQEVTGSISSVSGSDIRQQSVTSVDQALQGRASGVHVSQNTPKPGSGATVRIRGNRSITASNEPLYVVDGVPISDGLRDINSQDIESIEILKDASATAIYGARGANGVVIITTTRGNEGDISVNYHGSLGFSQARQQVPMMDGPAWVEMKREAWRAADAYTSDEDFLQPVMLEMLEAGEWTDYQDLVLQTGIRHDHQLGVTGGTSSARYYVSFGALQDEGIVPGEDFSRYNTRLNIDVDISERFRIGTSTLGSYSRQNGANVNRLNEAIQNVPLTRPYDEDGNLVFAHYVDAQRSNPLFEIQPGRYVNEVQRQRLLSNIYGEFDITNNIMYRLNFAPDLRHTRRGDFQSSLTNARQQGPPTGYKDENFTFEYTLENLLTYEQTFDLHSINLTGLFSVQDYQFENSNMNVSGIPVEQMQHYNFGAAEDILGYGSTFSRWSIISTMARANYNYFDRYLITFTGRMDGSSRFGEEHKWGIFPSVALGWNISNEPFFGDSGLVNDLRLRVSWGQTGQTGIQPYQTLGLLSRTAYNFGSDAAFGFEPAQIRNDDLRWETTSTTNIGLEFELLDSRIMGNVDVYQQNTTDLLLQRQLPTTSGFSSILENVGATRNTGVELSLTTHNFVDRSADTRGFEWSTDVNFAHNSEEIVELYGGTEDDVGNQWFIGHPIDVHFDLEKIGIWQLDEADQADAYGRQPGEIKIRDVNGDGSINADDRIILGQSMPKFSGGLNNTFRYRGVDLSVFLIGSFGNMIYSSIHGSDINALVGRYNNLDVDYWTPDNPTNDNPRPTIQLERPVYNETRGYLDGSFVKVRNISLGYALPDSFAQRIGAQVLRVYANAEQPFIFSPYVQQHQGIDPENSTGTNTPSQWRMLFGIDLTF